MVDKFNVSKLPIVKVVWTDAESFDEDWHTEEEIVEYIDLPLKVMHSVGWLLCDDNRWVIVAQSAGNDRDGFTACNFIKIPREMIFSVTRMDKDKRMDLASDGAVDAGDFHRVQGDDTANEIPTVGSEIYCGVVLPNDGN